jgi:toxin ParE1/3/4
LRAENRFALFLNPLDLLASGVSARTAQAYVGRIRARCRGICDAPMGSVARDDLVPGVRMAAFEGRVLIAYTLTEATVEIINVFYGGRDYEAFYRLGSKSER